MSVDAWFQRQVIEIIKTHLGKQRKKPATSFATITAVDGSNHASVTFDGETTATTKFYMRNGNYVPVVADRVVMQAVGNSYVIAYKIS